MTTQQETFEFEIEESVDIQSDHSKSSSDCSDHGGQITDDSDRAADVLQTSNESVCSVEKPRKALWTLWNRTIREMGLKQRILHDVWEKPRSLNGKFFCESFRNNSRNKRGVFIVAVHGEHLHVIHDCAYTNLQCRCAFMQKFSEQDAENISDEKPQESSDVRGNGGRKREQRRSTFGLQQLQKEATQDFEQKVYAVFRQRDGTGSSRPTSRDNSRRRRKRGRSESSSEEECEENLECKKFIDRWNRRRYPTGLYDGNHWINLIFYLSQCGRSLHSLQVGRETWIDGGKTRNLFIQRLFQEGEEGMVASRGISCDHGSSFIGPECSGQGVQVGIGAEEGTEGKEIHSSIGP